MPFQLPLPLLSSFYCSVPVANGLPLFILPFSCVSTPFLGVAHIHLSVKQTTGSVHQRCIMAVLYELHIFFNCNATAFSTVNGDIANMRLMLKGQLEQSAPESADMNSSSNAFPGLAS